MKNQNLINESFLREMLSEAMNQGYSLQDIVNIAEDISGEKSAIAWGKHGSCKWTIDSDGTLSIEPQKGNRGVLASQATLDYTAPWEEYRRQILRVVVKDGVSAAKDSAYLFSSLLNCKQMDLSRLDTSKAEDMEGMLRNCPRLESVNLKNWRGFPLNMGRFFEGDKSLKTLDLTDFYLRSATNVSAMFRGCENLEELRIDPVRFKLNSPAADTWAMFEGCHNFKFNYRELRELKERSEKIPEAWHPMIASYLNNSKQHSLKDEHER